jgi:cytochrome P450
LRDLPLVPLNGRARQREFVRTFLGLADDTGFNMRHEGNGEIMRFSRVRLPKKLSVALLGPAFDQWRGETVFVTSPRMSRELHTQPPGVVNMEEGNKAFVFTMGSESPLVLGGRDHVQARRAIVPEFTAEAVKQYHELSVQVLDRMIDELPLDAELSLLEFYTRFTQEVILRVVFGLESGRELEEYKAALYEMAAYYLPNTPRRLPGYFVAAAVGLRKKKGEAGVAGRPDMPPKWISPEGYRLRKESDALIVRKIRELREQPNDSVATRLIAFGAQQEPGWSDKRIRDAIATLLLAGHDTSAMAYSWATEFLMHNAEPRAKLIEEALAAQTDRYAQAANLEATRLKAPVWGPNRFIPEDCELGGYRIRKNTWIFVPSTPIHYDEELYPEPAAYRPERFLDKEPDRYGFMTFSAGPHRCPGAAFFLMEASLVLHRMFGRLELQPSLPAVDRTYFAFAFFNRPKHGTRVRIRSRKPANEVRWYRPQADTDPGARCPVAH